MIEAINRLEDAKAKMILAEIMGVYLEKGFGVMNKTEFETLLYDVLRRHGLLTGKCFDDSFKLRIPEAKARKLIYESQVKYSNLNKDDFDSYLRKSVGECLAHAYLVKNNKEIRFAIEDKYLRIALNAKLRERHYFADTSFNKDIISLDEEAFKEMLSILVPNFQRDQVLANLNAVQVPENDNMKDFVLSFIKEAMLQGSLEAIKQIGTLLIALAS
jgi:hypothetical protein